MIAQGPRHCPCLRGYARNAEGQGPVVGDTAFAGSSSITTEVNALMTHETRQSTRRIAALAVVIVLAISLAGCENFSQGPIAVRRDGSHLLIAVCADITAVRVYADFDDPKSGIKSMTFMEGVGSERFAVGDVVSTGHRWVSMPMSTLRDPSMRAGDSLEIVLTTQPQQDGVAGAFNFVGHGLSDKSWQHPDGTTTAAPCGPRG